MFICLYTGCSMKKVAVLPDKNLCFKDIASTGNILDNKWLSKIMFYLDTIWSISLSREGTGCSYIKNFLIVRKAEKRSVIKFPPKGTLRM